MVVGAPIDNLLDILELIERIERQTAGLSREMFIADPDVQWTPPPIDPLDR